MKSINNNLILFSHQGYQIQLTSTNEVILFHPGHPVCRSEFPELDHNDRVLLSAWDWLPEPVEEKLRVILLKVRSLPPLPRSGTARAFALTNPFAEPGMDYVKNWEDCQPVDNSKRKNMTIAEKVLRALGTTDPEEIEDWLRDSEEVGA